MRDLKFVKRNIVCLYSDKIYFHRWIRNLLYCEDSVQFEDLSYQKITPPLIRRTPSKASLCVLDVYQHFLRSVAGGEFWNCAARRLVLEQKKEKGRRKRRAVCGETGPVYGNYAHSKRVCCRRRRWMKIITRPYSSCNLGRGLFQFRENQKKEREREREREKRKFVTFSTPRSG